MLICFLNRELRRMNDECADKIADNRFSIDNSRDWLVTEGGVIDRVHRMSAKTVSFRNAFRDEVFEFEYFICFKKRPKPSTI